MGCSLQGPFRLPPPPFRPPPPCCRCRGSWGGTHSSCEQTPAWPWRRACPAMVTVAAMVAMEMWRRLEGAACSCDGVDAWPPCAAGTPRGWTLGAGLQPLCLPTHPALPKTRIHTLALTAVHASQRARPSKSSPPFSAHIGRSAALSPWEACWWKLRQGWGGGGVGGIFGGRHGASWARHLPR